MKRKDKFSDWREDLIEVTGIPEKEPKTDTDSEKEITEKKIKNKIVINPSMKEAFEEIGGTLLEVTELDEKLDMKKADMGDVIDDFYKSDAPQFKGKSKKKRREMAIAAKLNTEAMSVVDQMKASAKYWKENPRKDYKAGDGVKRNERDARANAARKPKDTRTSQQRMNDAVGKSRAGESD
jgi:hypothetical protein